MADEFQTDNMQVQQAVSAALDEQKKKKRKKRWIIIGVIVGIIILVIVAVGTEGEDTSDAGSSGGGAETVQKVEEKKSSDGKLGDYVCTVKSATKCKNWEGKDSVKIVYSFTNNASSPQSFDSALTDKVFQDGIGLETTFTSNDDSEIWDVQIKPGITKEVTKIYELRDSTTPLEIEVSELVSFSDDVYKTTIKF